MQLATRIMLLYRTLIRRRFCSSEIKFKINFEDFLNKNNKMGFEAMDFVVRHSSKISCKKVGNLPESDCLSYDVSFS